MLGLPGAWCRRSWSFFIVVAFNHVFFLVFSPGDLIASFIILNVAHGTALGLSEKFFLPLIMGLRDERENDLGPMIIL